MQPVLEPDGRDRAPRGELGAALYPSGWRGLVVADQDRPSVMSVGCAGISLPLTLPRSDGPTSNGSLRLSLGCNPAPRIGQSASARVTTVASSLTKTAVRNGRPLLGQRGQDREPVWSCFGQSETDFLQCQRQGELLGVLAPGNAAEFARRPWGHEGPPSNASITEAASSPSR